MPQKNDIANALLKYNYFPVQKKNREELPPLFDSGNFDEKVAIKIAKTKLRKGGYDQVEYLSTRFNNVPRPLSIPHPQPYSFLSLELMNNWSAIESIAKNKNSVIKPKKHKDGRIIIMDYDQSQSSTHRHLKKSQGKKYIVHTDIANFFNSIYTHAIPWALVGIDEAKKNKKDESKWYNKLDKYQRLCKRDETIGIPIGPGTSNFFAECILSKIDEELISEKHTFSRFIDDYTAYCSSKEESERFISELTWLLKKYKLSLNIKKTFVLELPSPSTTDWVADLSTRLPKTKKIKDYDAIRFLDYAVNIQRKTPDGSILKYAVKTITKRLEFDARISVAKYALNLAYQYPIIIPLLDPLIYNVNHIPWFKLETKLTAILEENLRKKRSDGICWSLFLLKKHCLSSVPSGIAEKIIETEDCLSISSLYAIGGHESKILKFAKKTMNEDLFSIDEQWLLLYQLFHDKKIENPYKKESLYSDVKSSKESNNDAMKREVNCFNILKKEGVSFIKTESLFHPKMSKLKSAVQKKIYSKIKDKVED